ncbi:LuxR family transcriptional regulator [Oricola cellulosilytica]|uniref:LuxR family transcriptional regulator n=2 Tax=Oricola cellulosilytica TaxID=1429082 RepID=A0A4R0PJ64_9HYPH|nr:LuxR family transcriptional regulator [Oricola cellulosilytica]
MVRETGAFSSEGEPALGKEMRRLFGDLVRRGGTGFASNVRSARLPFVWEPALDDDTGRWISALQSEVAAAVLASRFYVFFRRSSAGVDRILIAQARRASEVPSHDTLLACHGLAQVFFDDLTMRHRSAAEHGTPLTPREKECLAWSAEGKTSEEIAMILSLSAHTVNHYLVGATKKLDAANRMHAITIAIRTGILNIDGNLDAA